ncbi:MAG: universal stress protein [Thermodesulfobacteriota bacterium]
MKIMVGYDGSNAALDALRLSIKHAKAFDAKVEIVRSMKGGGEDKAEKIELADSQLAFAEELLNKAAIPCETHLLVRGMTPGEDMVQFAKEKGIESIILGVKRRSKVGKILFGSNAQYVILNAPCPVITVH